MSAIAVQTEVKEHPLLFCGEMVRATLEGRKTVTRRIVTLLPNWKKAGITHADLDASGFWNCWRGGDSSKPLQPGEPTHQWQYGDERLRQNYQAGDYVWGRETLIPVEEFSAQGEPRGVWAYYAADRSPVPNNYRAYKTIPSIYMPRSVSRIVRPLTTVRIQRLQDITDEDILAEGFTQGDGVWSGSLRAAFVKGWNGINGKRGSWDDNPFVFRLEFPKFEQPSPRSISNE